MEDDNRWLQVLRDKHEKLRKEYNQLYGALRDDMENEVDATRIVKKATILFELEVKLDLLETMIN